MFCALKSLFGGNSKTEDVVKSNDAMVLDMFSPTVEFLSQPQGLHDPKPWDMPKSWKPELLTHLGKLGMEHDEVAASELRATSLHVGPKLVIPLSMFCVCGESEVGDMMAHDTGPLLLTRNASRIDAKVARPFAMWVHVPEAQTTLYLYAQDNGTRQAWVMHVRHNLEVLRYGRSNQRKMLEACWTSLFQHGIIDEHDFQAKIPFVKQALLVRYLRPMTFEMQSQNLLCRAFAAVEQNDLATVRNMIKRRQVHVDDRLPREFGKLSMLMVAVLHDCEDMVREVLLPNDATIHLQNTVGDTALLIAARLSRQSLLVAMLAHGGDPQAENDAGESAMSEASEAVQHTMQRMLGMMPVETSRHIQAAEDAMAHTVLEGVRFEAALFQKKIFHLQGAAPFYRETVVHDQQPAFLLAGPFRSRAPMHELPDEQANYHGTVVSRPPGGEQQKQQPRELALPPQPPGARGPREGKLDAKKENAERGRSREGRAPEGRAAPPLQGGHGSHGEKAPKEGRGAGLRRESQHLQHGSTHETEHHHPSHGKHVLPGGGKHLSPIAHHAATPVAQQHASPGQQRSSPHHAVATPTHNSSHPAQNGRHAPALSSSQPTALGRSVPPALQHASPPAMRADPRVLSADIAFGTIASPATPARGHHHHHHHHPHPAPAPAHLR